MQATTHWKDNFPRGQFLGGYCQRAFILMVIVWEQSSRGNYSWEQFPGRGQCPREQSPREQLSGQRGAIFRTPDLTFLKVVNSFLIIKKSALFSIIVPVIHVKIKYSFVAIRGEIISS